VVRVAENRAGGMEGGGGSGWRFRNLRDISVVMGIVIVKLGAECDAWIESLGRMLNCEERREGRLGGCFDSRKTCGLGIDHRRNDRQGGGCCFKCCAVS